MSDVQDRGVDPLPQVLQEPEDLGLGRDVERGCGFVRDHEGRLAGQCHGDHHTLLHPAAELVRVLAIHLHRFGDPDEPEQVEDVAPCLLLDGPHQEGADNREQQEEPIQAAAKQVVQFGPRSEWRTGREPEFDRSFAPGHGSHVGEHDAERSSRARPQQISNGRPQVLGGHQAASFVPLSPSIWGGTEVELKGLFAGRDACEGRQASCGRILVRIEQIDCSLAEGLPRKTGPFPRDVGLFHGIETLEKTGPPTVGPARATGEPLESLDSLVDAEARGIDEGVYLVGSQARAGGQAGDDAIPLRRVQGHDSLAE